MPFDLKNTNPAERFYYPNYADAMKLPEDKQEWVDLRLCIGKPLQAIEKQTRKEIVEHVQPMKANGKINRRAQLQRITYLDWVDGTAEQVHHELTTDHMITGYNLFDTDGKKIKCTKENKMKLLEVPEFDLFIAARMEILVENKAGTEKEQEKNLPISSPDSTAGPAAKTA